MFFLRPQPSRRAAACILLTCSLFARSIRAQSAPSSAPAGSTLTPLRSTIYHDGWIDLNKNGKRDVYEDSTQPLDKRIDDLLAQMITDEKTCQLATLYGYTRVLADALPTPEWKNQIWKDGIANIDEQHNGVGRAGPDDPLAWPPSTHARAINETQKWFIEETRLGIPVDFTDEGIRGVNAVRSTNFPAQCALGAAWDTDLITKIGEITGKEGRALGFTNIYSPILDLARDPRWGRVVESYGEDPFLVAELALRQVKALQAQGVAATAKHFAVYSEPKGGRDGDARTDPHVTPREVEMLHLYPWRRVVQEAGLMGGMCAYNDYDGIPMADNHEFLVDRLRSQWGFKGYIVSDSGSVEQLFDKHRVVASMEDAAATYIREGGNVWTNFRQPSTFIQPLRAAIAAGKLPMSIVDQRVRDVLRVKLTLGLFDHPYVDRALADAAIHTPESAAIALRAARESIVLLKNQNNTLPLSKSLRRILVCGPSATITETSHDRYGSIGGDVQTLLDGIKAAVPNTEVIFSQGANATDARWPESEILPEPPGGQDAAMIADAVAKAADADAIIVALGDADRTIGEGKSRTSLDLPGFQNDLVQALAKTAGGGGGGKPLVVVLMTGRAASINWIDHNCPAILEAWFPGEAGGRAIADVLFGDYNPGGKLPITFPRTTGQLPLNFPYKPSSQTYLPPSTTRPVARASFIDTPLYTFGYGLSYTTFAYSDLKVEPRSIKSSDWVGISFFIRNTGQRAGDEIVQLYLQQALSSVTPYDRVLRGFQRITLQPGEMKPCEFFIRPPAMQVVNRQGQWAIEPGLYHVFLGSSSTDIRALGDFTITAN